MSAVVLAVGSELLRPGRRDTNAEWLVDRLLELGIETRWRAGVADDDAQIAALLDRALRDASVVIVTGGLGPTEDDRTRAALARALGVPLERDPVMVRTIDAMFADRRRVASPRQHLQADRPKGTTWIANPLGTAPGLLVADGARILAALPGVPSEMRAMFSATVAPLIRARSAGAIARRTLHVAGRPESWVDERIRDLYATPHTETTILASSGTVELLLIAWGRDGAEAQERLETLATALGARLGDDLFGVDGDTLASVCGALLAARRETVAVAESCTGGLLGAAFTDVPGASAWFRGGLVCYANDLKVTLAGVPEATLRAGGAVSEGTALALARGARTVCGAAFGLGVTGIAGPAGGSPDKPVGRVHVAVDDGRQGQARTLDWPGDRALIRRRAVAAALDLMRRRLLTG